MPLQPTNLDREAVVFDTVAEGFARALGPKLTPELRAELRELAFDVDQIGPVYTLTAWESVVQRVATRLFPAVSQQEAWRQLGRQFMDGYVQTTMGKATLAMGRLIGVKRTLQRMTRNFRTAANYLDSHAQELGEREVELTTWMLEPYLESWRGKPVSFPFYRAGVVEGTVALVGGKEHSVELVECDWNRQVATYRVRWS